MREIKVSPVDYSCDDEFLHSYMVEITETLQLTVTCLADTPEEAEELIRTRYTNEDYVLTADNFSDVEFNIIEGEKRQ